LRHFLIQGEEKPVNVTAFFQRCKDLEWPKPDIRENEAFDVESWLKKRALDAAASPSTELAEKKLKRVIGFARLIGLETDFRKAIQSS